MFNFGLRAHDYGKRAPDDLAAALAPLGPVSIQLALSKALQNAPGDGGLSPGYARSVRKAFDKHGIAVAVLGCYINPVHPDREIRNRQLARFEEHISYAPDFGCSLVGTETGSLNPDCSFHPGTEQPETFDLLCASVERLLLAAEKRGVFVGLEPVASRHTISTVERMRRLLDRFPSPCLKVIYDPVNLIPDTGLDESQEAFFNRAFDAWGGHIAAIHAKDFRMENGTKSGGLPALTGAMDYRVFLRLLAEKKPGIDILLENSVPETISLMRNRFPEP